MTIGVLSIAFAMSVIEKVRWGIPEYADDAIRTAILMVNKPRCNEFYMCQGSKFAVAMVANATTFCHLLSGCSTGSKHLLLP